MENKVAAYLAAIITVMVLLDWAFFDWQFAFFWARKGLQLIDALAFWR